MQNQNRIKMVSAFLAPPLLPTRRPAVPRSTSQRRARMSVHPLRARTLAWVLPVLPSGAQAWRARLVDHALLALALLSAGAGYAVAAAAVAVPFGRAAVANGKARAPRHAALLLGTIEGGAFCEGDRTLPVPAPPRLHGAPAATLVLADDPRFEAGLRVEQVYVPRSDEFLLAGDRVRRGRLLKIIEHAYNSEQWSPSAAEE